MNDNEHKFILLYRSNKGSPGEIQHSVKTESQSLSGFSEHGSTATYIRENSRGRTGLSKVCRKDWIPASHDSTKFTQKILDEGPFADMHQVPK